MFGPARSFPNFCSFMVSLSGGSKSSMCVCVCVCVCMYVQKIVINNRQFTTIKFTPLHKNGNLQSDFPFHNYNFYRTNVLLKQAHSPNDRLATEVSGEVSEEERFLSECLPTGTPTCTVFGFTTSVKKDTRSPTGQQEAR